MKRLVESGGGGEDWKQIASYFTDRSDIQCQHRWQKVLNPELIKGPWTKEVSTVRNRLCFFFFGPENSDDLFSSFFFLLGR